MIVLGVDPGIIACGWGLYDSAARRCLLASTITQSPKAPATDRIEIIGDTIAEVLDANPVELVVCEDQDGVFWAMQREGRTNPNAGKLMALVEHLHRVARERGVPFTTITPTQIRSVLGCRREATKAMIARALRIQCTDVPLDPKYHSTDGLAAAVTGARRWQHDQVIKARRAL